MLKDEYNRTVILRGCNVLGHLHDAISGDWESWDYYDSSEVDLFMDGLQRLGVNCVRDMTHAKGWVDDSASNSDIGGLTYQGLQKDFIARARARGIYVILSDFTVMSIPYHTQDWAGYGTHPTSPEEDNYFSQAQFITYSANRNIELGRLNNYIASVWNEMFYMDSAKIVEWQTVYNAVIAAMRAGGSNTLMCAQYSYTLGIWGTPSDVWRGINWYVNYPLTDLADNYLISFHWYRNETGQITYAGILDLLTNTFPVITYSASRPLICEEVGADDSSQDELDFLEHTLTVLNENRISFLSWVLSSEGQGWDELTAASAKSALSLNSAGQIVADAVASGKVI